MDQTIVFDSLTQLASFGGLSVVILGLVQLAKLYVPRRFLPLLSAFLGSFLGAVIALYADLNVLIGLFNGLFAGLSASGIYDSATKTTE